MSKSRTVNLGFLFMVIAGIYGMLLFILINNLILARTGGKFYRFKDFRVNLQETIRITNSNLRGIALRNAILSAMKAELRKNNIHAKVLPAYVSNRRFFAVAGVPMLVVKNTKFGKKYFDIGIVVNGDTVSFSLLGRSRENTKKNMHNMYKNGTTITDSVKSMFYCADEFELQKEVNWQQDVFECFNKSVLGK